MDDRWPVFKNEYLNDVCRAFRSKSRSIRYSGILTCEGGVDIENWFFPRSRALKFQGRAYYPGGITSDRADVAEGMYVCVEPHGAPTSPTIELWVWDGWAHFEVARATKKKYGQTLVALEAMKLSCRPRELVEVFRWTVSTVALLSVECESDRDREILKSIKARWQTLVATT